MGWLKKTFLGKFEWEGMLGKYEMEDQKSLPVEPASKNASDGTDGGSRPADFGHPLDTRFALWMLFDCVRLAKA